MHAEFVACYGATIQAIWLRNFISELKVVDSSRDQLLFIVIRAQQCFFQGMIKVLVGPCTLT